MDEVALYYLHAADSVLLYVSGIQFSYESLVYLNDYLIYSRQDFLHQSGVPLFESLLHNGVVGVVEHLLGYFKGSVKGIALVVNELSDELRDRDDGVSVIELYGDVVLQALQTAELSLMLAEYVRQ